MNTPVSRIRPGILRGKTIGNEHVTKDPSLIATAIDGSMTILAPVPLRLFNSLQWARDYCIEHNLYRVLYPGKQHAVHH
jgi:hypothetical protein